jgi:ABC-2 type transport system permease protein
VSKVLIVAWREFLETVRTRAFFFGVILMPGLMIALIWGSERIARITETEHLPVRVLAVQDEDGRTYPELEAIVEMFNRNNPQRRFELQRADPGAESEAELLVQVRRGELYAYLSIPAGVVEVPARGQSPGAAPIAGAQCRLVRKDSQLAAGEAIREMLDRAVRAARFRAHEIAPELVERLSASVTLAEVDVVTREASKDDSKARMLTPFLMMFMIYLGTMSISMGLLTSVLEEKSSRIMEVLLAALNPLQLMAGKILGIVGVGLVMMGIWFAVGFVSARSYDMGHLITGYRLLIVGLYFLPALLFSAALLAAVGSACNSLKEAQSMSSPLTLFNIIPLVAWPAIVPHPDSALALVLSFIPPITPFVMILRISADPATPMWQIAATLAVLWLAVLGAFWAAAKIFRIGVLMHGQPPTLRELARWVRRA